jgi:hypothetical protein
MNAADYYGLDELKRACSGFIQCCVTVDTVCALLATAERYIQYKCTKYLVQKVLEFVDEHGNDVLNLGSFALLPQHVVRLILAREELKADEFSKFQVRLFNFFLIRPFFSFYHKNPKIQDFKKYKGHCIVKSRVFQKKDSFQRILKCFANNFPTRSDSKLFCQCNGQKSHSHS